MSSVKVSDTQKQPFIVAVDKEGNILKVGVPHQLQVGITGKPTFLSLLGGLALERSVDETSAPRGSAGGYVLSNADAVFFRKSTTAAATVVLPDKPNPGQVHIIKDASGVGASFSVTITTSSTSILIDGTSSATITSNYGCKIVMWNGTSWSVII